MLFNTIGFAVFYPIIFVLNWFITNRKVKIQNLMLLLASFVFYSFWNWKFLFLLIFSIVLDYSAGLFMNKYKSNFTRKLFLCLSVSINLAFLGFFKYYNFFVDSFIDLLNLIGFKAHYQTLNILLPVGISFYTFHGLSYVIDIYKRRIEPEKNFVDYALFVSYFPLLVAGPIERATHLLPQIKKKRVFNYYKAIDGLKQVIWGLFKKVVIADTCAVYVNDIFSNYQDQSSFTLIIGAIFFSFQIYGDFSGYSDIALGISRMLGIELLKNFSYPYFSRDIAEFWRRWHISLTSWFRDYIYIPLGGSKGGKWLHLRNTFIVFIVSGFWHGANWTFVFWGLLNAFYFLPLALTRNNRKNLDIVAKGRLFPNIKDFLNILFTFILCTIAWIFFRSISIVDGFNYISLIFSKSILELPAIKPFMGILFFYIIFLLMVEWIGRENNFALEKLLIKNSILRYMFYYFIIISIILLSGEEHNFIYFQF